MIDPELGTLRDPKMLVILTVRESAKVGGIPSTHLVMR